MKSLLCCPVCRCSLERQERCYKCENGHSFDIAKEGYVNLSPSSAKVSGDDKNMVKARTLFLDKGYYLPLRDKISSLIKNTAIGEPHILDSGCGEGYYTSAYCHLGKVIGIDLSKEAVKKAAKRCGSGEFAAASVFHMPISDDTVDILINCFSPLAVDEFSRVLKTGGYFFYVVPGAKHLWELKEILYDYPYENVEKAENYNGFEYIGMESVYSSFQLSSNEEIAALYHMTPYTWTTPKDGAERLSKVNSLDVTADFNIHIYKKI